MVLWIMLATLYVVLLWTLGLMTFRNGHYVPFCVGIVFPVLWIVGALVAPTASTEAAEARTSLP
jgi:hypothetical protein